MNTIMFAIKGKFIPVLLILLCVSPFKGDSVGARLAEL
ncbi:hypothetical protein AB07_0795 [Citrobacter freundii]|nr:hypothetical protein AB07_0795 [Citrobacter freundii]